MDDAALRAELDRRAQRHANTDASVKLAGHGARLTEGRRGYVEDVDAADAECQAVEAALAQVAANPKSALEDLFRAYVPALCLMVGAPPSPPKPLPELAVATPCRAIHSRAHHSHGGHATNAEHKAMSFAQFVDRVVEGWVTSEMVAARNEWLGKLTAITDRAESDARAAAEHTEDGHVDIDVPESFNDQYENAVAKLGDSSAGERLKIQRRMFVDEAGGKEAGPSLTGQESDMTYQKFTPPSDAEMIREAARATSRRRSPRPEPAGKTPAAAAQTDETSPPGT